MAERVGFISTRFAGTDGVSLESAKWAEVLWDHQHFSFWYAGRLDRAPDISMCVPEAYFGHPANQWIQDRVWGVTSRDPEKLAAKWSVLRKRSEKPKPFDSF